MKEKMICAQAQLMQRASLLQITGLCEDVYAFTIPSYGIFRFAFADLELVFNDEHSFNDKEVDELIEKMDKMIADAKKKSEFAVRVFKTWGAE